MQIVIGEDQLVPLIEFLEKYAIGNGDIVLTENEGALTVEVGLAYATIGVDGEVDEA